MKIDSHYIIGDGHDVCQDYAAHRKEQIVLCDGCSSSPDTDIGARLLAQTTLNCCRDYNKLLLSVNDILNKHFRYLDNRCLDSTLLNVYVSALSIWVNIFGDGIIAWIDNNYNFNIQSYEFVSGAPYYLNYYNDIDRNNHYIELYGKYDLVKKQTVYFLNKDVSNLCSVENATIKEENITKYIPYKMPIKYYFDNPYFDDGDNDNNIVMIAIFSDGVKSFRDNNEHKEINYLEVVRELMNIKSYTGNFVKRRLKRYIKECNKNNISHYDDVSMACMYFGE